MTTVEAPRDTWVDVCDVSRVIADRGVAALVNRVQIAVFVLSDGSVYAVSNFDPFSSAFVISRGLVGSVGDAPTVASPMYKQRFDLRSGTCLDDPSVQLRVWPARVEAGRIQVAADR